MKIKTAVSIAFVSLAAGHYVYFSRFAPGFMPDLRDAPGPAAMQLGLGGGAAPPPPPSRAAPVETGTDLKFYVDGMQVPEPPRTRLPCARTPGNVYLACQFPSEKTDQKNVGSCHAFAAIALIEAAYYRQYDKNIKFSEADLLVRNTIAQDGYYSGEGIREANSVYSDIRFALDKGVSRRVLYERFLEQYYPYREEAKGRQQHINSSFLVRLAVSDSSGLKSLLRQERMRMFLGKYEDKERLAFRDQIKDFRLEQKQYLVSGISNALFDIDSRKCRENGKVQKQFIISELEAGRPVAIVYNIKGMRGAAENDFHGAIVYGMHSASVPSAGEEGTDYENAGEDLHRSRPAAAEGEEGVNYEKAGEGDIFYLRNSGFGDSEFKDSDMCRITEIFSLIVPADGE